MFIFSLLSHQKKRKKTESTLKSRKIEECYKNKKFQNAAKHK